MLWFASWWRVLSDDRWLSVDEIATYLGVERKGMPANKVGRLWKFKLKEVDSWVRREAMGWGMIDPASWIEGTASLATNQQCAKWK